MFIDDHREHLGVEAICKVLPIAPSTYYHHKSIEFNPEKASARAKRDAFLMTRITHFWEKSRKRYGAVKVWHDLLDEGPSPVAVSSSDRQIRPWPLDQEAVASRHRWTAFWYWGGSSEDCSQRYGSNMLPRSEHGSWLGSHLCLSGQPY